MAIVSNIKKFPLKEYKVENAPVGTRFMFGGHSTVLIVTDGKNKQDKEIVCVSESGSMRKIPYGTKIMGIKSAKNMFVQLSLTMTNLLATQLYSFGKKKVIITEKSKPRKGIKTGILIKGIRDKHTGKKPEVIECKSVYELRKKLRDYLPAGRIPPYKLCLSWVKESGYVSLIKEEVKGKTTYRV